MQPLRRAPAVLLLALALGSCNAGFRRFTFQDGDGHALALRESPGIPEDREGILEPARGTRESPYYGLARPAVLRAGRALAIRYESTLESCEVLVYAEKKRILARASLPPAGTAPVRFLVPVAPGETVHGFGLATTSGSGRLELLGAGVEPMRRGFSLEADALRLDSSVRSINAPSLAAPLDAFTVELSQAAMAAMEGGTWLLRLSPGSPPEDGGSGILGFLDADGKRSAEFSVRSEGLPVDFTFTRAGIGFLPGTVSFSSETPGWGLLGLDLGSLEDGAPIPADPGQVLSNDRRMWRNAEYELYAWDRFPDFLVMDTADYAVLDLLFNRLAFYVEKAGTAGRVLDDADLKGKHAYNAHDYRAEDLARFFTAAQSQGVKLNRLEDALRRTLESGGILVSRESGYAAGRGGILAISRVGGNALRELLLTHESFHGVFFSLPEYRAAVEREWSSLSPAETRVWKAFLGSKGYNTEDSYLLVNEFQAYLFQQDETAVAAYQATILARLAASFPALAGDIAEVRARKPAPFLASFRTLDAELRALGGPRGGRVVFISPLD